MITYIWAGLCNAQEGVRWEALSLRAAQHQAAQTGRLVLVHFWSPNCRPCQKMDRLVFSRPDVAATVETYYVPVKINADQFPYTARQFGITELPTDLILSPNGQVIRRFQGAVPAEQYIGQLQEVAREMHLGPPRGLAGDPSGGGHHPPRSTAPGVSAPEAVSVPSWTGPYSHPAQRGTPSDGGSENFPMGGPQTQGTPPTSGYTIPPFDVGQNSPPGIRTASALPPRQYSKQNNLPVGLPEEVPRQPLSSQLPGSSRQREFTKPAPPADSPPWQAYASERPEGSPYSFSSPVVSGRQEPFARAVPSQEGTSHPPTEETPEGWPPGLPPLGLEGYCPVQLVEKRRWVLGVHPWGVIHEGRTYMCAGPEEQKKFLTNPQRYAPVLSGNDVVWAVERGLQVPGRREYGVFYRGRVYLFAEPATLDAFRKNPHRYVEAISATPPAETASRR